MNDLKAGASIIDVTPQKSMFLHGYPHVERMSEGVHDPLFASAMIIDNGETQVVFCAVDILFISSEITSRVRNKVESEIGIPGQNIMITASHTHSGPITVSDIFYDPVVPKADPKYNTYLVEKLIQVILDAYNNKRISKVAITMADGSGVGGNRRSVKDAIDPEVPIIVLKDVESDKIFALSTVYCMHPTVLHEDSKLYSADFPGYTREFIKSELGDEAILLYHTGPSGNQSPRHFVKANTFDEAKRLGYMLGERIVKSIEQLTDKDFLDWITIEVASDKVMLPKRKFMSVDQAEEKLLRAKQKFENMKKTNAPVADTRTAEVDLFGAEENRQLAEMAANGELEKIYQDVLPAEISLIVLDGKNFVFLPGEIFVEYSLRIKEKIPNTYIVSLANGVLLGYLVTKEAELEGGYEASNSIFPSEAGDVLVEKVISLLKVNSKNK